VISRAKVAAVLGQMGQGSQGDRPARVARVGNFGLVKRGHFGKQIAPGDRVQDVHRITLGVAFERPAQGRLTQAVLMPGEIGGGHQATPQRFVARLVVQRAGQGAQRAVGVPRR
jgi:hypothetical protein